MNSAFMDAQDFRDTITEFARETHPNYDIEMLYVDKPNNASYYGLSVSVMKEGDRKVSAVLDVEKYYKFYADDGMSLDEVKKMISDRIEAVAHHEASVGLDIFNRPYEEIKKMLSVKLIPKEKNYKFLSTVVFRPFKEFAIVPYIIIEDGTDSVKSANINLTLIKAFGVSESQIVSDAIDNSTKIHPTEVKNLGAFLTGNDDGLMYIISNDNNMYGASAILHDETFKLVREKIGGSFYILPSSVHEVLAVSADNELEAMEAMVHDVNSTVLSEEDFLSDNVYYYDAVNDIFGKARDLLG